MIVRSAVLTFVALAWATTASAVELEPTSDFSAALGFEEGAVLPTGQIDIQKVAVFVHARTAANSVAVYATLEERDNGRWRAIGSFVCDVGNLAAEAHAIYRGHSCTSAPVTIRPRRGTRLRAALNVRHGDCAPPLCAVTAVAHTRVVPHTPTLNDAIPLNNGGAFDADFRLETDAIDAQGRLDPHRVAVFVRAANTAQDVHVVARLEARINNTWTPLGDMRCGVGTLQAGQTAVYRGNSCNQPPNPIIVPANAPLRAVLSVQHAFGAQTQAAATDVARAPTPQRVRGPGSSTRKTRLGGPGDRT